MKALQQEMNVLTVALNVRGYLPVNNEKCHFNVLQEERFRTERLEEQINDLTELHQNEVENLKQAMVDMEEKVQYQSEERLRDIHEMLEHCQTKVCTISFDLKIDGKLSNSKNRENTLFLVFRAKLIDLKAT